MGDDVILAAGSRSMSYNIVFMEIKELCVQLFGHITSGFPIAALSGRSLTVGCWSQICLQVHTQRHDGVRPSRTPLVILTSSLCKYSFMVMVCESLCLSCHPAFWTLLPVHFNRLFCVFCGAAPPPCCLSYFCLNMFGLLQASFYEKLKRSLIP